MSKLISDLWQSMPATDSRRERLAFVFQWALVAIAGLIVAPAAFSLLTGLAALLLSGTAALAAIAFAPVLAMRLANWRIRQLKGEATANPIPTLENELMTRKRLLQEAGESLVTGLAQVEGFVAQAEDAAQRYPAMATQWKERAAKVQALAAARKRSYQQAKKTVDEFEQEVDRCRIVWKLIDADRKLGESMGSGSLDPMSALMTRTAVEAVMDRMNAAFAGLELALLEDETRS